MAKEEDRSRLSEAERRYQAIFEQSPYGILIIDTRGNIIEFNEAAHLQLGYTKDEFEELRIYDIDPFQSPAEIKTSMKDVLRKGKAEFEVKHKAKDGDIRDVHVITRVVNLSGKRVFQAIWHDITEQTQAGESLRKYHERLEVLVKERTAELASVNEKLKKDILRRKNTESKLRDAFTRIKTLRGLLPMCAWCNKVRDDSGYWKRVETYIQEHSDASFTHGICPSCLKKADPETYELYSEEIGEKFKTEKRQCERVQYNDTVKYMTSFGEDKSNRAIFDADIVDVSEDGMCIITDHALKRDAIVIFRDGDSDRSGIVRWRNKVDGDNTYRVGVKFLTG